MAARHRATEHEAVAADLLHDLGHGTGDMLDRADDRIFQSVAVIACDLAQRGALGQKALQRALLPIGGEFTQRRIEIEGREVDVGEAAHLGQRHLR